MVDKKYRLLVVDDDKDSLRAIMYHLEQQCPPNTQYELAAAPNGKVALNIIQDVLPHLIITDWDMPDMDGIALIKALKETPTTREIPVIIVTGVSSAKRDLEHALSTGAVDYIPKPLDAIELQARVTSALRLHDALKVVKQQKSAIEEQTRQLQRAHHHLSQSIEAAKSIQEAILPFNKQLKTAFYNHFILYRPRNVVSGDFYWLKQVGNKYLVGAIDCTGHGVPGAFMSMIGYMLLNQAVQHKKLIKPVQILEAIRNDIHQALRQNTAQHQGGMDVALLSIEPLLEYTLVEFSGAKRPLWYITPLSTQTEEISGDRISIGTIYRRKKGPFTQHLFKMPHESILYIGSDGLTDQNNPQGKKFSVAYLRKTLFTYHHHSMSQQSHLLEVALETHQQTVEQRDDILLMGIKLDRPKEKLSD